LYQKSAIWNRFDLLSGWHLRELSFLSRSDNLLCADLIVLNSKQTAIANRQVELLDLIEQRKFSWDKVCELGDALAGKRPGRSNDQEIIYYKSNTGVGIQFAAAGAVIRNAERKVSAASFPTSGSGRILLNGPQKVIDPRPDSQTRTRSKRRAMSTGM
jgi:hypothetical protein